MKYIIACMLGLGLITGTIAQTPDSSSGAPSFNCFYIDEDSFQCDRKEGTGLSKDDWAKREGNTSTERDRKFDPNGEVQDDSKASRGKAPVEDQSTSSAKRGKYSQPEKESDTGIMEEGDTGSTGGQGERDVQGKAKRAPAQEQEDLQGKVKRNPAPSQRQDEK